MNDIDSMPPKCHDCPYWEMCEEPYICPKQDEKKDTMRTWIDELYLEIKSRWNKIRALPDASPEECAFLVHLMEEIEKNTDD